MLEEVPDDPLPVSGPEVVVVDEVGGTTIEPGESIGTINLPCGISAELGCGNVNAGRPASA